MMNNKILYLAIAVLLGIILLQKFNGAEAVPPKVDTFYQSVVLTDTIKAKPITLIKTELDTQWLETIKYVSDSNYPKLLEEYQALAEKYSTKKVYQSVFDVKYGKIKVIDTIGHNSLINSNLELDIDIPEKIIVKPAPPVRQLYVGVGIIGAQSKGVTGGFVGGLYKDRKDRVFGANIGVYDDKLYYGVSNYWKIKK